MLLNKPWRLVCSLCQAESPSADTRTLAFGLAKKAGWVLSNPGKWPADWLCPHCYELFRPAREEARRMRELSFRPPTPS